MKLYNKILSAIGVAILIGSTSCVDDLNLKPNDPNQITELTDAELPLAMMKCYSSLAVSGQGGPNGSSDISGLDGGTSQYTRALYMLNEFPTDEVKWIWKDAGVIDLNTNTWGPDNPNIFGTYSRLYVHIAVCNNFLRITQGTTDATIQQYRLEARALRAFSYYNVIDLFGGGGFADENMQYGVNPVYKTRLELYNWLEGELTDLVSKFPTSTPNYGRVGLDGVQALLARLYLNAKVFTGGQVNGYADCSKQCAQIIARHSGSGYMSSGLANNYLGLFCGTNNAYMPGGSKPAQNEILWGIPYDATYIEAYGGTMFLTAAAYTSKTLAADGYEMNPLNYGTTSNWGCMHSTSAFADKFTANDIRWSLWCKEAQGFKNDNSQYSKFEYGYAVVKFTNLNEDTNGQLVKPAAITEFPNADLPLIRLADVYLMYAESNIMGGVGDAGLALTYVNYLRDRAGVTSWTASDMTADNILDERCRELYWENTRRTDLIRFNKFTGANYLWPWKGNNEKGTSIDTYRNLFPIPTNVLAAQPDFTQNPGY